MQQQRDLESHAERLRQDGVVVIDGYLDADVCEEMRRVVESALDNDEVAIYEGERDYMDLVNAGQPIMNERSGETDDGMLDVFNVDFLADSIRDFKEDEFILDVIERATGTDYIPLHTNAYVNESVTDTRPYHADSYGGLFKSFVYLTHVPDESYGPYSYVLGSNDPSFAKRKATEYVNKFQGKAATDAVFFDEEDTEVFTAPKGTLIISDQSGYHRGMPQAEGKRRMLVNTQYQPADEYEE